MDEHHIVGVNGDSLYMNLIYYKITYAYNESMILKCYM